MKNIVVITIEHLAARALGCYGNPVKATPHLDRFASEAVRFENCTVPSPLCVASRVAFFTGRYPSVTGSRDNTLLMQEKEGFHLPRLLKDAGVGCGLFGKNHCFPDAEAAGFEACIEESPLRQKQRAAYGKPFPGPAIPIDPSVFESQTRRFRWGDHPNPIWYGGTYPFDPAESPARANVNHALDYLERKGDEPSFVWLSFSDVHPPYRAPEPFATMYRPEDMPLPHRPEGELDSKPFVQQVYYHGGWLHLMDDAQLRQTMAYYYGMLRHLDDCLGKFFDGLKAIGRWDDTIIVATGDHGEYLGEHGLIRKTAAFYDCIVQVPLIVRGLEHARDGATNALQIEQIDLMPTLLQSSGISIPPGVQGRSVTDMMSGMAPERDCTYAEVGSRQPLPEGGPEAELDALKAGTSRTEPVPELPLVESGTFFLSRGRMVRNQNWKYAHYVNDRSELYDLQNDPGELVNLAGNPDYRDREEAMRRRLLERTIEAGDPR